jgi:ubiquinone/menaquinone biosynthesis C-methylase UbiE
MQRKDKEKYYDAIANGYDELYGMEQKNKMELIRRHINVLSSIKILDIGCGTGISTDFDCFCIGIDPSAELIKIARQKDKRKNHDYIVLKAEDIRKLKFKKDQFDYVLAISSLHHVKTLSSVLKEIKRVGKKFIFSLMKRSQSTQKIINTLEKNFRITEKIEEDKDLILFCDKI